MCSFCSYSQRGLERLQAVLYMHLQYKCFYACVCLEIRILDFYSSLSTYFYERYVYFGNQYRCGKFYNLNPDAIFFFPFQRYNFMFAVLYIFDGHHFKVSSFKCYDAILRLLRLFKKRADF